MKLTVLDGLSFISCVGNVEICMALSKKGYLPVIMSELSINQDVYFMLHEMFDM